MPEKKSDDTYGYKGWLVSDHFIKRAFAVYGHYLVANLIVATIFFLLALFFVLTIGGAALFSGKTSDGNWNMDHGSWMMNDGGHMYDSSDHMMYDDGVVCTQEAKLCPDGSSVGRSGPNCEFDRCPSETRDEGARVMNWKEGVFGKAITLKGGETVIYEGGLELTLRSIGDSRCPKDVVCIWQGELNPFFSVRDDSAAQQQTVLRMGTETAAQAEIEGYVVELVEGTEMDATIVVTQQ